MLTEPAPGTPGIEPMTPLDIERGMDLVRDAGWNQTPDDWAILLRLGRCFGIRDENGRLIASSAILPYPPAFGWIGMVLVDQSWRRQGLASRLLSHAIARIRAEGLVPMLDATPAGREVYLRLGFKDLASISRWRGQAAGTAGAARGDSPAQDDIDGGIAADAAAFGASRDMLLTDFADRPGALTLALPGGRGMLWSRAGRTATQIGPLVAADENDALTLCAMALEHLRGPVMLDLPDRETSMAAALSARGFSVERSFSRMALGATFSSTLGADMRVIAGPELG